MTLRTQRANAIRALTMDAVQKANSGHPGAPMGMADIAEVLWNDYMRHNPANPSWPDRDRFILSNGHGSMLIYALSHLTGYDLSIDDLKNFRQLHSRTPGHPEYGYAPGVDTTTGPLGQGISNGVGMALAEKTLAAQFNRTSFNLIDHYTYVFLGDGCLMEGISHEACSLAGTLGLSKLIAFYDDNGISIDGHVEGWFTDNTPARFEAYGWQVIPQVDGHDTSAIKQAIEAGRENKLQPTLICCQTIIGKGAPNKQGSELVHGAALGEAEIVHAREFLNWPYGPFEIPEEIYESWDSKEKGMELENVWNKRFADYSSAHPQLAEELTRRLSGELPPDFSETAKEYAEACQAEGNNFASRKASQNCLSKFGPLLPELLGGSADLAGSNLTLWDGAKGVSNEDPSGNYIYYGVREFGMSAIMNGIALHGGFIPYGATFLIFMEYARNAVRMSALMKQRCIFVYTHDSIGLGEDGPTHQPVEQLTSLRSTPDLNTWRPCDTVESAVAWTSAIQRQDGPSALIFSRQSLKHQERNAQQLSDISRGAYILLEPHLDPELIIVATGSEVGLAIDAAQKLADQGKHVRVVSMPCSEIFEQQPEEYREAVFPKKVSRRLAVEAAHRDYWYKYVGLRGRIVGMDTFGESAPSGDLLREFGFTVENVISVAQELFRQ